MNCLRWAAAATILLGTPAIAARTADYSRSEEQFREDAAALEVAEFPAMPSRGGAELVIENPEQLDHRLKILGISCSAWKVENPLSQMVVRALGAWDRDGVLGLSEQRPLIRLKIGNVLSTLRCVQIAELNVRCMTRTAISGEATVEAEGQTPRTEAISVKVEQQPSVGACGVARAAALSGRAASILLVEKLEALVAN
jgi:hypothetical protein